MLILNLCMDLGYVVDNLTFVGEGGIGELVWVRIFFQNLWSYYTHPCYTQIVKI